MRRCRVCFGRNGWLYARVQPGGLTARARQTVVTLPSATARSTSTASPELRLDSIINFRDVAGSGAGLAITGGGHMTRGVVFRSGKLQQLSAADRVALIKAGVSDIFDLRTVAVAKRSPDPAVGRAKYHLINIFGVYETHDPVAKTPSAARRERQQMNRRFVTDPKQRERIGSLMRGIAGARGRSSFTALRARIAPVGCRRFYR